MTKNLPAWKDHGTTDLPKIGSYKNKPPTDDIEIFFKIYKSQLEAAFIRANNCNGEEKVLALLGDVRGPAFEPLHWRSETHVVYLSAPAKVLESETAYNSCNTKSA